MIDWEKPIETVPDALNPQPVPCRRVPEHDPKGQMCYAVFIEGGWIATEGDDPNFLGNDFWWYEKDGETDSFLPRIRNVENAS